MTPTSQQLAAIVGADHVRVDAGTRHIDRSATTRLVRGGPGVVVFPGDAAEVAAVLRLAGELGRPVIPRGAGHDLRAYDVPHRGGIVLSLTRMNRLLELDAENGAAVCQPGLPTVALGAAAAGHGLLYPPDPGSRTTSTIGGNVAEKAGGLRGLKYGVTRDYVLGCEAVLSTGATIRAGGKLVKDVAGYDVLRLLCGSEGTLAVLTELTLRLVPAPPASGLGLACFDTLAAARRAASRVLQDLAPATLQLLDAAGIRTIADVGAVGVRRDAGAALIFGQDGDPDAVTRDLATIAQACRAERAISTAVAAGEEERMRILQARDAALELGGTIAGEPGVGPAQSPFPPRRLGPAHLALLRRVNHAFDPQGILNPGRLG